MTKSELRNGPLSPSFVKSTMEDRPALSPSKGERERVLASLVSGFGIRISFGFRHSDFGFHLLLLSLAVLVLAGCAGYKLGRTNGLVARERSIQINPFSNQTLEPRVGEAVTFQLRKQLQRDGTYELASHDNGDIIVTG